MNVTLRIILHLPPPSVDFALQKGSGSKFDLAQKQTSTHTDLSFELAVIVREGKNGEPDFFGPYVQGPSSERFIYIGIGKYAGTTDSIWERRLKIPLRGMQWAEINKVNSDNDLIFCTVVPGSGKDGSPNCATVKPFNGWMIVAN